MLIWGVHVHVGLPERDRVMPVLSSLLNYDPRSPNSSRGCRNLYMDSSPEGAPPTEPEKPRVSTPLVVVFSVLLCVALPILPIYLWRKERLSAAWGIGLAVAWFALYVTVGVLAPEQPTSLTSAEPAETESSKPTPKPTATKTTPTTTPTPTPTVEPTKAKPTPCADIAKNVLRNPAHVFKCQYGKKWPLTVPQGIVGCRDKPGTSVQNLTFFDPKGKEWALNGTASSSGYPKIDPIWRDDPDLPGAKIDIGPLTKRAANVCD